MKLAGTLLVLLSALGAAGCALDTSIEVEPQTNTCETSTDCGDGAACVTTAQEESVCVATSAQLGSIIVEVQLTGGTGASYLFPGAVDLSGDDAAGLVKSLELALPKSVAVSGRMMASASEACRAQDGGVPVSALFHRRTDAASFRFDLSAASTFSPGAPTADFALAVPPGEYDVYLQPPEPSADCPLVPPPRLVRGVVAEGEALSWTPPEASFQLLTGDLIVPEGTSLEGWIVEIVDPTYGHVVSDKLTLGIEREQLNIFESGIRYYPIPDPILRLRDPEGDLSVHWVLGALDLDSDGHVEIDLQDLVATPMPIEATIIDSANNFIPNATVVVQSIALTGSANQNATYRVATTSDAAGVITVNLVPGTYAISIIPQSDELAPLIGTWEITADAGGSGLGFTLEAQPVIRGNVSDAEGVALPYAPIVVAPAPSSLTDYFSQILRKPTPEDPAFWPTRSHTGSSDASGDFELAVDPGLVDLFVQMPSESGYPWFVLPRFLVDPATNQPVVSVPDISLRYPVLAQGRVSNELGTVSYAVVRAWIQPTTADGAAGEPIQIGATSTDESGLFVLPLPPSITLPAPSAE